MRKPEQFGTRRRLRGWAALGLALTTGCATNPAAHDPMLGDRIPATQAYPRAAAQGTSGVPAGRAASQDRMAIDNPPALPAQPVRQTGWSQPGGELTWEQARQMLRDRRVDWQRLDQHEHQWVFCCSIPDSRNPSVSRHYRAQGATELEAIQLVLQQIDAGQ